MTRSRARWLLIDKVLSVRRFQIEMHLLRIDIIDAECIHGIMEDYTPQE
jgi:hypothetical protein